MKFYNSPWPSLPLAEEGWPAKRRRGESRSPFIDTFFLFTDKHQRSAINSEIFNSKINYKPLDMELLNRQKRVLVLDKDSRIASVVDEMMWYGDWDVSVTYDPNAVYDLAKAYRPDLVILDHLLLDNDCELICQDFKDDAQLQQVPIIVITKYKTKKANEDRFKCDALFIKPLDMQVLASRMDHLMAS